MDVRAHLSNTAVRKGQSVNIVPQVNAELIQYLESRYPDRISMIEARNESIERIAFYAGAVSVVAHLRELHDEYQAKRTVEIRGIVGG